MFYRKLKIFIHLQPLMKWLIIEAYCYLILSYLLLRLISFKRLSQHFEVKRTKRSTNPPYQISTPRLVSKAIMISSKYTPWKSLCYDRAIAAKWMLNKREIDNHLILGTYPYDNGYEFHAWITHKENMILNHSPKKYVVIAVFSSIFK